MCAEVQSWEQRIVGGKGTDCPGEWAKVTQTGVYELRFQDQMVQSKREERSWEKAFQARKQLAKGLREKWFLMRYQSSEQLGGEYTKATNVLSIKELVNKNLRFLLKKDHSPGWGKRKRELSFISSCFYVMCLWFDWGYWANTHGRRILYFTRYIIIFLIFLRLASSL